MESIPLTNKPILLSDYMQARRKRHVYIYRKTGIEEKKNNLQHYQLKDQRDTSVRTGKHATKALHAARLLGCKKD